MAILPDTVGMTKEIGDAAVKNVGRGDESCNNLHLHEERSL